MDATTATAIAKLLRASTAITAILTLLQTFNVDISAVLAFGGLGGLAVGMAAKDLIANFFGGLTIYLDKPFKVGDWIRSPDRQIEGTVEYIGWRQTRIRTFDKRPLYIPNATFTQIAVENPSRMTHRRIYETFGLRYQDARVLEKVVNEVRDYLRKHDDLATDQTLIVNVNEFADSSVNFFVYCFTKTTDWVTYHRIKEQVLLDILKIIHKHGADVAFPTRTVQIEGSGMAHMAGKQGPEG
jgi:MscS family membrane protein